MKTPSKKEVKEYFKNAKEVRCLSEKGIVDITKNIKKGIHYCLDIYWIDIEHYNGGSVNLWEKGKYAEIISYIEPTTEVRNSVLLQLAENNSFSEEIIRKECPKLFDSELKVGKWYKSNEESKNLIYIESIEDNGFVCYGFDYKSKWMDSLYRIKSGQYKLATPQEVETAFKNLFIKLGFVNGVKVSRDWCSTKEIQIVDVKIKYHYYSNTITIGGREIFKDGKFAEIIETHNDIITIVEKYGKDKAISLIEKM